MIDLSLQTIRIIALSKVLLVAGFVILAFLLTRKNKFPGIVALLISLMVVGFYLIVATPLQTMWWGNNGDEIFIVSFLSQVLSGNPLADFYYQGLPAFYPPLYFWVTGLLARPFVHNAIGAAKLGSASVMFLWFAGSYLFLKLYHKYIAPSVKDSITSSPWFWVWAPVVFFFLLDFDNVITKPYETLPALGVALFIGLLAQDLQEDKWRIKHYLFYGLSGGLLFLTYYFWWFMAIPSMFILAFLSARKLKNNRRIIMVGAIMFAVAAIYVIPLFLSYGGGMENWQALYFTPKDLSTFVPFTQWGWKRPLYVLGVIGLILYREKMFIKANIVLLLVGYGYQLINIVLLLSGNNAMQAAKPFLFLGTASLSLAAAYLLHAWWRIYALRLSVSGQKTLAFGLLIFSLPLWPMVKFIDDPVVQGQIEKDLQPTSAFYLALEIKKNVPDYQDKTWLSSGIPDINAYLPLHYFVAHNPHFSHHAAMYSQRMDFVETLTDTDVFDFVENINNSSVNALLLYNEPDSSVYPLFFWADNYPNGGEELRLDLDKKKVQALNWSLVYDANEWEIYIKQ